MTVGELIEKLNIFDPDLRILMIEGDFPKYTFSDVQGVGSRIDEKHKEVLIF